ncbi:MAG: hypothetical protein MUF52_14350 [Syntrophobacteraceae bacterium]|nr:hypothetical protein [Syntrophobacteraceae bacterium]
MPRELLERTRRLVGILRHYRRLHEALERSGPGAYRITSRGAWATSRPAHVYYFMKRLGIENDRFFVDLGSGDGLVACVAGLFTRSVGIEADPDLCRTATDAVADLELCHRVEIVRGDYLTMNLRRADCLYLYPDKPFHALEELLGSWPGRLLVYGPHFPPGGLIPGRQLRCGRERIQEYRARLGPDPPAALGRK